MSGRRWYPLSAADDYESGKLRGHLVAGVRLCVGRSDERWFAIDDTCPHAGGSLTEGMLDEDLVICPLHAYGFEIETGRCLDDPACGVRAYPTRVEDGILQVEL